MTTTILVESLRGLNEFWNSSQLSSGLLRGVFHLLQINVHFNTVMLRDPFKMPSSVSCLHYSGPPACLPTEVPMKYEIFL